MSSGNDVQDATTGQLRLEDGTQALVSLSSMQDPLQCLPVSAFENLLVVTSKSPDRIAEQVTEMGANPDGVGVIPITGSTVTYDGPLWTTDGVVPDDLTGLSMKYSTAFDALAPGHGWVLFDSLDVCLLYANEDRVFRFVDHVADRAKRRDVRGVYALVRDAVDDRTYSNFRRGIDAEIDLR